MNVSGYCGSELAVWPKFINSKPYRTLVSIRYGFNTFNFSIFPLLHLFGWRVSDFVTIFRNKLSSTTPVSQNRSRHLLIQNIIRLGSGPPRVQFMKYLVSAGVERRSKCFKLIVCRVHNSCRAYIGARDQAARFGVVAVFFSVDLNTLLQPCEIKIRRPKGNELRGLKITYKRPKNVDYFCCRYVCYVRCCVCSSRVSAGKQRETRRTDGFLQFTPLF